MVPTLNIAALTHRTGVPSDTIRKWEQRYGVLRPGRTPGGQRRYTELDIARVEWLKARLEEGFRIGEAAALLGAACVAGETPDDLRHALVDATTRSDVAGVGTVIEQALLLDSLGDAFTAVLAPALIEIGDLWESGSVSVAQEHLATAAVDTALRRLISDPRASIRGTAVLACAPGERHEIGLLMVAVLLRADGWEVAYLGPDTPTADAFALAAQVDASAVLFSAACDATARTLEQELGRARVPASFEVVIGGRAADGCSATDLVATLH